MIDKRDVRKNLCDAQCIHEKVCRHKSILGPTPKCEDYLDTKMGFTDEDLSHLASFCRTGAEGGCIPCIGILEKIKTMRGLK